MSEKRKPEQPIERELWELAVRTSDDLAIAGAGSDLERSILFSALECAAKLTVRAAAPAADLEAAVEDAPRPTGLDGIMAGLKEAEEKYGAAVEDEPRCNCGADRTGPSAEAHLATCPQGKDAPRDVDWRTWFCDAHRPIRSHAKGMCFVCNALKLMREGEDAMPRTCEHGVEAGEHCSVCGTLSPPRTPLLTMKMIFDALEVMEQDGYTKPKFGALGAVRFTDLLNAALRAATPAGPTIRTPKCGCDESVGYLCNIHAKDRNDYLDHVDLLKWLEERRENCLRLMEQKTGEKRLGWLEDSEYFRMAIAALRGPTIRTSTPNEAWGMAADWINHHVSNFKFWTPDGLAQNLRDNNPFKGPTIREVCEGRTLERWARGEEGMFKHPLGEFVLFSDVRDRTGQP